MELILSKKCFFQLITGFILIINFTSAIAGSIIVKSDIGNKDNDCYGYPINCEDDDDLYISVGAIIGIIVSALVFFIGIPILLCFCCACCCCKSRRKGQVHTVYVVSPEAAQQNPAEYEENMQGSTMGYQTTVPNGQEVNPQIPSYDYGAIGTAQAPPPYKPYPSESSPQTFDLPPPYPVTQPPTSSNEPNHIGWTPQQS